jgi:hypothetical protein
VVFRGRCVYPSYQQKESSKRNTKGKVMIVVEDQRKWRAVLLVGTCL